MGFLVFSVLFSVAVSVLLKLARRYRLDIRQAIVVNYFMAAALVPMFLTPDISGLMQAGAVTWGVLLALGVILPAMFWMLAQSVSKAGMVRTDAAMRLSLLLPLVAAFWWFGDLPTSARLFGCLLGFVAIVMIVRRPAVSAGSQHHWLLLVAVFLGMGSIDILFKLMAGLDVASALLGAFLLAAVLSLAALLWLYQRGHARWHWRHGLTGLLLGGLNFGNILCYLYAHQALAQRPSLVFAGMNIGVMVLAALVGRVLFHERLSAVNWCGILVAIAAVTLLA